MEVQQLIKSGFLKYGDNGLVPVVDPEEQLEILVRQSEGEEKQVELN